MRFTVQIGKHVCHASNSTSKENSVEGIFLSERITEEEMTNKLVFDQVSVKGSL